MAEVIRKATGWMPKGSSWLGVGIGLGVGLGLGLGSGLGLGLGSTGWMLKGSPCQKRSEGAPS